MITSIVTQVGGGTRGGNARNNNVPSYNITPEQVRVGGARDVMTDNPLGRRFKDGTDVKITGTQRKELDDTILNLTNADVHALCDV